MTRWHLMRALLAGGLLPAVLVTAGLTTAGPATASAPPGGIASVVAGGPGGPDPAADVSMEPCGVKFARGQLYIGGTTVVYRVSRATGRLVAVAGAGPWESTSAGSTDEGAPASDAQLTACGVATDAVGSLLLADGPRVRVVAAKTGTYYQQKMTAGHVYTIASGFNDAVDVELDPAGNLLVADHGTAWSQDQQEIDSVVWVLAERTGTFYGRPMTAGRRYIVAGGSSGGALGSGIPATTADLGIGIGSVRPDAAGNLVMADEGGVGGSPYGNSGPSVPPAVRVVAARSGTFYGQRMTAGRIYTVAGGIFGRVHDGGPALKSALTAAAGVAFDHNGNVVAADGGRVRVIAVRSGTFYGQPMKAGYLYAIAGNSDAWGSGRYSGDGGPAAKAGITATSVAVDSAGNVLVGMPGRVLAVPARTGSSYGRTMTAGHIYSVAGNGYTQYSGDGRPAASAELFPYRVGWDRPADLTAAADPITGVIRVVPGRTETYFGRRMTAGDIYTIAGDGLDGYAGDGGPATAARLNPTGVTADPDGNLLVADWVRIRAVAARSGTFYGQRMKAGYIYTIAGNGSPTFSGDGGPARAAGLSSVYGLSVDRAGDIFVDGQTRIRMIAARSGTYFGRTVTAGDIYTIAGDGLGGYAGIGGPGPAASFYPGQTAVDRAGNVLITAGDPIDNVDHASILVVPPRSGVFYGRTMTAGYVYEIAGPGVDTVTTLNDDDSVAVDPAGNIAVSGHGDIEVLAESTGTYYGRAMTSGQVYGIAGYGRALSGPAADAEVGFGDGLAVGSSGNLLLSDTESGRILSISR
jgi:hypothetical protein